MSELIEETITISLEKFKSLEKDSAWLECLEAAGVDNWQGYEDAIEIFEEEYPQYKED